VVTLVGDFYKAEKMKEGNLFRYCLNWKKIKTSVVFSFAGFDTLVPKFFLFFF